MYPMDVLEAESEGLVGYLLEQSLQEVIGDRQVVTMLTRVEVDPTDPEFLRPSQPTGPLVDTETAGLLAAANKWLMVREGKSRRRAVASPEPRRVLESRAIEHSQPPAATHLDNPAGIPTPVARTWARPDSGHHHAMVGINPGAPR
jgi:carbamate kinase